MKKTALVFVILVMMAGCATLPDRVDHTPGHLMENCLFDNLTRLLAANGYPILEVKYCIWNNPNEVNAILYPDNVIVVTTGLLDRLFGETEGGNILAAILAHELAHFKLKHFRNREILATSIWVGITAIGFVVPGAGFANLLINPAVTNTLSRSQELDADREAVEILKKADWPDAPEVCIKMLSWGKGLGGSPSFILWRTHPPLDDRIANIRKTFGQNP